MQRISSHKLQEFVNPHEYEQLEQLEQLAQEAEKN